MAGLFLPNDDLITTDGFPATGQATGAVYTVRSTLLLAFRMSRWWWWWRAFQCAARRQ
jgi:hypothetical protein